MKRLVRLLALLAALVIALPTHAGPAAVPGIQFGTTFAQRTLGALGRPIRVMALGDSTTGATASTTAAWTWRRAWQRLARAQRDDLQWIGSQSSGLLGYAEATEPWHEGHPGYSVEQLTAGYAGWVGTAGQPDLVLVSAGLNNFGSDSAAICLSKISALLAQIRQTSPAAIVVVWSPPHSPTASPNEATRNTFVAGLGAVVGLYGQRFSYVDAGSPLDSKAHYLASDSPQWTHPNDAGYALLARAIWAHLSSYVLPPPTGAPFPRPYATRPPRAVLSMPSNGNIYWSSNAAMELQGGNWLVAMRLRITSSQAQAVIYSDCYSTPWGGLVILQGTLGLNIYLGSSSAIITGVANAITLNAWQTLIVHGDIATGTVSVFVDGTMRKQSAAGLAWTTPGGGDYKILGYNSSTAISNGVVGAIADLVIARGASVPSLGSDSASRLALRRAAEAYHYDLALPPGISAHYPISEGSGTVLASDMGGSNSGGFAGAPSWSAAGTIPTSWDAM